MPVVFIVMFTASPLASMIESSYNVFAGIGDPTFNVRVAVLVVTLLYMYMLNMAVVFIENCI